ncbi:MAG: short-chain dehydrogenase/reductase [Verrucomicrobiales bacterium]|jgi:NAD(P)-dependent dehydrogenase (short-subunit alcohol dehydrogenase family)|nr:short-chain dehydrogenase/reductase [Verrucomicrobiales bacterium]
MDLKNTVCLITGGTKGIGASTAVLLAERGADVAVVGRSQGVASAEVQAKVERLGRKFLGIVADISKPEEARRSVRETIAHFGTIDVLVHSAGGPVPGTFMELTAERWHSAFDTHVHPIFHLCQEAIPVMKAKKQGVIIFISSSAGIRGVPGAVAYQAVKGLLPQLTRAMARETAADNVRINCVAPGVIRTAFHDQMPPEVKKNNLENRIPLKREGTPEQVAELILQMITNDYITGETFSIDGGLTMRIA